MNAWPGCFPLLAQTRPNAAEYVTRAQGSAIERVRRAASGCEKGAMEKCQEVGALRSPFRQRWPNIAVRPG